MSASWVTRPALVGLAALGGVGCEPPGAAFLVVEGVACRDALPATFAGATPNVPFDEAFRVTDDLGDVPALDVAFGPGSDPAVALLRAPFQAEGAVVVPIRVLLPAPGVVRADLVLTPAPELAPCTVAVEVASGS